MKICACCFADEEIKQYIANESSEKGVCDYCREYGALLEVGELLDFFKQFLAIFQPSSLVDEESLTSKIQKDWSLFTSHAVCHDILSDIILATNRDDLKPEINVEYCDEIKECVGYWSNLKLEIKTNRRFITDIERLEELGWDYLFPKPLEIDSTICFYRARIHEVGSQEKYDIDKMGVPPTNKSTSGRANPVGIPYLYLSKDTETTLYETRALYLDNLTIGVFKVLENNTLKVIDLTGEQNSYRSPFISDDITSFVKSKLLMREISQDLSKPLRRHDSEIEYVPTQFICEYIRYFYGVDGIMFKSSLHKGGINYVIFNHELIKCIDVKQYQVTDIKITGTQIS